jgi:hypothetical protein
MQVLPMSAHDELRGTLSNTICNASNYTQRAQPHLLGSDMSGVLDKTADAILAAGYRKIRTITTEEERKALHDLTVVRTSAGTIACLFGGRAHFFQTELTAPATVLALPITILFDPAADE